MLHLPTIAAHQCIMRYVLDLTVAPPPMAMARAGLLIAFRNYMLLTILALRFLVVRALMAQPEIDVSLV